MASLNQLTLDRLLGTELGSLPKKQQQVRKRTQLFWQLQIPITANKTTPIQAVRLTVSMLKQNPKCVDLSQDEITQERNEQWDLFGKTGSLSSEPISRLVLGRGGSIQALQPHGGWG